MTHRRCIFVNPTVGRGPRRCALRNSTNLKSSLSVDFRSFVCAPAAVTHTKMYRLFPRGWGIRASLWEGIQDFEKQPRGGFSLVALRKAGGARSVTEGERGRKEDKEAPPLRISHTHSPPPPMAEPFLAAARSRSGSDNRLGCHSLPSRRFATSQGRLGQARALTTVQVVIHYPSCLQCFLLYAERSTGTLSPNGSE